MKKALRLIGAGFRFVASGFCEKDRLKVEVMQNGSEEPDRLVLSMSRMTIALLLAVFTKVVLTEPTLLEHWPAAVFGVVLAFALPVTGALKSSDPEEILKWAQGIMDRLGEG